MLKLTLIIAVASIAIPATAQRDRARARLTSAHAIRLAVAKARAAEVDFTHLLPATAKYDAKERWWLISWREKPPIITVGGGYGAVVEDTTGEVTLIPGR
jgi:hypothetical protein